MSQATRLALPVVAILCVSAVMTAQATADSSITAYLRDGRAVSGVIDAKTDAEYLWLRRSTEQFDLASGYRWEQVIEGRVEDRTLAASELREWTATRKQAGRRYVEIAPGLTDEIRLIRGEALPPAVQRVKTLVVDAELAQWDKDAQTDGLRVFIYPLDAHGYIVPVHGHVELTLVVERDYTLGGPDYVPGPEFVEGDRLTFPVRPEHFSTGAAFYELPFAKWHPDFELTLAHQALLHARLSVPGQGVFEASDAQVCLREPSRFRDQLQLYAPGRYLPLENPSRDGR